MSNSLDPDQAQHFVGPDLGPNCLQRLSADDTGRLRVKHCHVNICMITEDIRIYLASSKLLDWLFNHILNGINF